MSVLTYTKFGMKQDIKRKSNEFSRRERQS